MDTAPGQECFNAPRSLQSFWELQKSGFVQSKILSAISALKKHGFCVQWISLKVYFLWTLTNPKYHLFHFYPFFLRNPTWTEKPLIISKNPNHPKWSNAINDDLIKQNMVNENPWRLCINAYKKSNEWIWLKISAFVHKSMHICIWLQAHKSQNKRDLSILMLIDTKEPSYIYTNYSRVF